MTSFALIHQGLNAIHLKDKEGNFIVYNQETRDITLSKNEKAAARFMICPVFDHDKHKKDKHHKHHSKSKKEEKKEEHPRLYKLMLHNKGCSVLFPMGWNGTSLFIPHKPHEEKAKLDEKEKKGKKDHSKKHHKKDWKKFRKMVTCTIEEIEITPETTNEQLDKKKVVFTHREGKKETTKELFFEKGAEDKRHREEPAPKEVKKEESSVKHEKDEDEEHEEAAPAKK